MYSILGTYREKSTEIIEDGLTKSEARNYLEEYRMSFGSDWVLWVEKEKQICVRDRDWET